VTVVMRILGRPDGQPSPSDDQYLAHYDPNGRNGRGDVRTTRDARAAMRFKSSVEALEFWRTRPTRRTTCAPTASPTGRCLPTA